MRHVVGILGNAFGAVAVLALIVGAGGGAAWLMTHAPIVGIVAFFVGVGALAYFDPGELG